MDTFPRWLRVALAVALFILVAGGLLFYFAQRQSLRSEAERDLQTIAQLKVGQIVAWRGERFGDASIVMQSPFYRDAVPRWLATNDEALTPLILERFNSLRTYYGYGDVFLVGIDGEVKLSLSGYVGELHEEVAPAILEALESGTPAFTDMHIGSNGEPHLGVVAPFYALGDKSSDPVGGIVLQVEMRQFLYPLILGWPTPSATAETLLIRQDGDSVLFLNELRHRRDTALNLRIPMTRADLPAVMAVQGETGVVEGVDYRGVEVLAFLTAIPDSSWYMVSKIDKTEALAAWEQVSTLIVILLVGAGLIIVFGALAIWQQNAKTQYRALLHVERERRKSEARYATTLMSIGDGVIATDAEGRVELLNPAAEKLTGWSNEEAHGRPLEDVFTIVNEESRNVVESPVAEVLRSGVIVGLANHTLLIAADGVERPIADSGAPIRDETGETMGVVLAFRDQSQERMAQRRLQAEMERAQQYLDVAGSMIIVLDRDAHVVLVNRRGCEILGYGESELEGQSWFECCLPERVREGVERMFSRMMHGDLEMDEYAENYVLTRGGEERLIAWHNAILRDESGAIVGALSSGEDITARRQAEDALRESEQRYRFLADNTLDVIWQMDLDLTFMYVNPAIQKLAGYTQEEWVGSRLPDHCNDENMRMMAQVIADEVAAGPDAAGVIFEAALIKKNGDPIWVEIHGRAVFNADEQPIGLQGTTRDITARRQAEDALRRSQTMLARTEEIALIGSWEWDLEADKITWSKEMFHIFGLDPNDDAPSFPEHARFFDEGDMARLTEMVEQAVAFGTPYQIEAEVTRSDGSRRVWLAHGYAEKNDDGKTVRLYGSNQDVTELREAERNYQTLFREMLDGFALHEIILDEAGRPVDYRFLAVNPAFERLTGLKADDIVGKTVWEVVPDTEMHWIEQYGQVALTGEPVSFENYAQELDAYFEVRAFRPAPGQFAAVFQDVTERRRAERELERSEALLNQAGEIAQIGGWEHDLVNRTARWTRATYDIVEIEPGHPIPGPDEHLEYYLPEYRPVMREAMRKLVEEGVPLDVEAPIRTQKGNVKWCRAMGQRVVTNGAVVSVFGMFQDVTDRRAAQQALRDSEERYRTVVSSVSEGIIYQESAGIILTWNQAAARIFGLEPDEVVGKDARQFPLQTIREDGTQYPVTELPSHVTLETGQPVRNVVLGVRNAVTDQLSWIRVNTNPVFHEGEAKPSSVVISFSDITELRQAEEELRRSEAFLNEVGRIGRIGGWEHDHITGEDRWTRGMYDIVGISYDQAPPPVETHVELFLPEYRDVVAEALARLEAGQPMDFEAPFTTYDGEVKWCRSIGQPETVNGEVVRGYGTFQDITELKQAALELEHQTALLQQIMDSAPDLIFFKDTDGVYLGCNTAFERFAGRPEAEQIGRTDFDFFEPDLAHLFRSMDRMALESERAHRNEEWVTYPDGSRVLLDTLKTPFYSPDGELLGLVGISRDITERRHAEEEREKLQGQLVQAQKMEAVGRLAGGVAHDFNNMLQSILGYSDMALRSVEPGTLVHESLTEIEKAGRRSADLTRQLLAFARRQTVAPKVLDLNDTVAGMLKMLRRLIGEDIDLAWMPGLDLWNIFIDPSQVDQILANLMVNARDAIEGTGRITIETENFVCDQDYCADHPEFKPGEFVLLAVSDDGCGMDQDTMSNIFDPFFTTKRPGEGTGLGTGYRVWHRQAERWLYQRLQ